MNKYGIHLIPIHNREEDYRFIAEFQPRIIKIVNPSKGHIDRIKSDLGSAFYDTVFIMRDHLLSEQKEEMARNPRALAVEHTERLAELVKKVGLGNHEQTFVEGINEPSLDAGPRPPINSPAYQTWYGRSKVLCSHSDIYTETLARQSAPIGQRIMGYLFSVGWPFNLDEDEPPFWGFFERSLDALEEFPHWIGLHEYWPQEGPSWNAGWFAYRWKHMPRDIPVAITECGLDEYVKDSNVSEPADRGWKNFLTSETYTLQQYEYYRENLKDPRFEGQTPFTSDSADDWQSYEMMETYHHVFVLNWEVEDINDGPTVPEPPPYDVALLWPTIGITTQRFGENYQRYMERFGTAGHNGMDFASAEGTEIQAVADGEVMWSDWDDAYGWYVRIWHEEFRFHSFYAHLQGRLPSIEAGTMVKQGDHIANMSSSGNSTGPHLHYELRAGEKYDYNSVSYGHTKGRFNPEVAYHLLNDKGG